MGIATLVLAAQAAAQQPRQPSPPHETTQPTTRKTIRKPSKPSKPIRQSVKKPVVRPGFVRPSKPLVSDSKTRRPPWSKPIGAGTDEKPLWKRKMQDGTVVRQGRLSEFAERTVVIGPDNERLQLRQIAKFAFTEHTALRHAAGRAGQALLGNVESHDHVIEMSDVFLLVKRTHIVVKDPGALKNASRAWARFLDSSGSTTRDFKRAPRQQKLDGQQQRDINHFIKNIAPRLPANHPLKSAAQKGSRALISAICEGKGDIVIQDTLSVRKRSPRAQAPRQDVASNVWTPLRVNANRPAIDLGRLGATGRSPVSIQQHPEYARLRCVSGPFAGQFVHVLGDDMPRHNIGLVLHMGGLGSTEEFLSSLRLVKVEGSIADYRIADVWNGYFVVVGKDAFLQSYGRAESTGTVFRLLSQNGNHVLVEPESRRFVKITASRRSAHNGFLALGTDRREAATQFSIASSDFQPKVQSNVFGRQGVGNRVAASIELFITRPDGSTVSKNLRTNRRGRFDHPFVAPRGSIVRATPIHSDYVFSPAHRVVDATHNSTVNFAAIEKGRPGGPLNFQGQFMAGFTVQHDWEWEREWDYASGFFRVGLGADANVGLRIPLEVTGSMTPGSFHSAADAGSQRVTLNFRGRAFDAPESFYEAVHLPRHKRLGGKEVVLAVRASYKLKFRALWKTWVDIDKSPGFDLSRHWTPPWAPGSGEYRIVIPPELTRSVVDFSVLRGEAIAAISLGGGNSQIGLRSATLINQNRNPNDALILKPSASQQTYFDLNPFQAQRFGFVLTAPDENLYRFDLYAVPEVKVRVRADVDLLFDDFSRTFETGWIRLNQFRFNLGSVPFGRHDQSIEEFVFDDGFVNRVSVD